LIHTTKNQENNQKKTKTNNSLQDSKCHPVQPIRLPLKYYTSHL